MNDKTGATCRNRGQITRAPRLRSDLDLTWSDHEVSDLSKSFIRDRRYFIKLSLKVMNHYKITGKFSTIRAAEGIEKFCDFNLTVSQ